MARESDSTLPWLVAIGAAAAAWTVWRRAHTPYYPDVALHTGLELLSRPRRVLAIGPHPDDLEHFVGGTLKLLAENGSAVTMAILSRGERATRRANIAEIRTREAQQSAAILGATLVQLDLPDGQIRPGPVLDNALASLWEQVNPDMVLAFDPKGPLPFLNNPDHIALGAAILQKVRRGITGGTRVYFYGSPQPNVLVDVTEVLLEKANAIRTHRSQLAGPDSLIDCWTRAISRLGSAQQPAMYTEGLYRLV